MTDTNRLYVKAGLKKYELKQTWLINQLDKYGVSTDKSELSSVLAGTRKGEKANNILRNSIGILVDYERNFERVSSSSL